MDAIRGTACSKDHADLISANRSPVASRIMEFLETGFPEPSDEYLKPTPYFDYDNPAVADFAAKAVDGAATDKEKAISAFYACLLYTSPSPRD